MHSNFFFQFGTILYFKMDTNTIQGSKLILIHWEEGHQVVDSIQGKHFQKHF